MFQHLSHSRKTLVWLPLLAAFTALSTGALAPVQAQLPQPVPSATAAKPAGPLKQTLPNGLTILVQENFNAPVVAVRFYVKTGSIYEGQHLGAGISHLFEHTLFEGTTTRTKEQINDDVQAIGGQSNAYTSKEVTCYYITTAAPYFKPALASLSDMMRNANFPEAEVKVQQGVIHNEMNLGEDDPGRTLANLFYEAAFKVHPVRFPIIGYREVFDRISREDIVSYYKTHYTPSNTVLSVAGAVRAEDVFAAARELLGDWERRSPQTPTLPDEPRQSSPRRAVVEKDVNLSYLMMGWHTIPLQHPDLYALDVLATIVGDGESSRLVREVRDRAQLVSDIGAYSSTPNYKGGTFIVRATLPPGSTTKVENAVWTQIGRLWREPVSQTELSRAQRQIEAGYIFNNSSVDDQAEVMAYDEMSTGDPYYSRRYIARIKAVTPAQIQAVAKKYLTREGLTVAAVLPRSGAKTAQTSPGAGGQEGDATPPVAAVAPVSASAPASANVPASPAPTVVTLPNGMKLIIARRPAFPTVAIVAMGRGGARLEPASKPGLANLTAQLLTRGTDRRSGDDISDLVDSLGGSLDAFSGYNSWGIRSQWLKDDWRRGLTLVAESVFQPTFPQQELARLKPIILAQLQQQSDDPMSSAGLLLRSTYFGSHPYGRSALGTVQSVGKIGRTEVESFWKQLLAPQHTVLAIYGDIDPQEVARAATYLFGGATKNPKPLAAPLPSAALSEFTRRSESKPGLAQAVLFWGYPGYKVTDEDRHAVDVLDAALSGSSLPGGRLHARLRDNQLVYVVHAYSSPGLEPGMFVVYAATTKDKRETVENIITEEMGKVVAEPISAAELSRAKSMAIAAHAISHQTSTQQAENAASNLLFGLGVDEVDRYAARINAVTLEDVQRVAAKYLRRDATALAVVEPAG